MRKFKPEGETDRDSFFVSIDARDKESVRVFRALLVQQGISEREFWMPMIHEYLAKHARLVQKKDLVGPKDLLKIAKEEYDLDLRREDLYGYRKRAWKKGRDYFTVMSGKKPTFSYDLKRLRQYFEKLRERRDRADEKRALEEMTVVTKKLGDSSNTGFTVMGPANEPSRDADDPRGYDSRG